MNIFENLVYLSIAFGLIILNGFFVAAEFALVKVRLSRIEQLVKEGKPLAATARWLARRLDESLSACQLGITMASLALGWVGEPAFASLVAPLLHRLGVQDENLIHIAGFIVAFGAITGLHLVAGEQFPKIFAIRRPESILLWCALPLKFFYGLLFPFLMMLNAATTFLLRLAGVDTSSEHEGPSTEEEIRALLREAHIHGNLSRNEHQLISNVFEFDDLIVRRVMLPRGDVVFVDINDSVASLNALVRRTKHTRYPVCDRSLDHVLGVLHIKDLLCINPDDEVDLRKLIRPPKKVPETMPISRVLRHFQATHQLMAFVIDEFGTITGMVTLENVLERIVGAVDDEFDHADPNIVSAGPNEYVVLGTTPIDEMASKLGIEVDDTDADTVAGFLMESEERVLSQGDQIQLGAASARILEIRNDAPAKIQITIEEGATEVERKEES
ncbi:MAG: HlyC/CorC family transporter [Planctomycetales bacterium]|nr:HlyC/CorC family transporter [Planctomycetales bacterium]